MKLQYSVSILSEAEIDLDTAYIWYEARQIGLGDKFYESVNQSVQSIAKTPKIYQEVYKGYRRCVISKFPYGIYYQILPDIAEIRIVGIIHFKRDPEEMKRRM
ncbi:MAG: type II toxin-antitoxin system RelE/ParE family toxin [Bacteroidetes bacterium]|nr:type II toxin-antitoxin system RelE/ParE family toxin [Bacteroidota bacterium]